MPSTLNLTSVRPLTGIRKALSHSGQATSWVYTLLRQPTVYLKCYCGRILAPAPKAELFVLFFLLMSFERWIQAGLRPGAFPTNIANHTYTATQLTPTLWFPTLPWLSHEHQMGVHEKKSANSPSVWCSQGSHNIALSHIWLLAFCLNFS